MNIHRAMAFLGVLAVPLLVACGASSGSGATSVPTSSTATITGTAPATASHTASTSSSQPQQATSDVVGIRTVWTQFFAGSTSAARKQVLLQNGRSFAAVLTAQSGSPLARSTTASVARVRVVSANVAQVTYTILLAGKPALADQVGTAVRVASRWRVSASSFCQLLSMEGQKVAACGSVSATTSS